MDTKEIEELQKELIDSGLFRRDGFIKPQWVTNVGPTFDFKNTPGETIQEKLYIIFKNNGEQDKCKICGNTCKFINFYHGYQSTCSPECDKKLKLKALEKAVENSTSPEARQKMIETNRERYGCDWPMQNKEIQAKAEATNLEKYGVKNPASLEIVKEKKASTNMKRYGAENPFASEIIKEKIKKTNLEKYGVEYPSQNEEVKKKLSEVNKINFAPDASIWDQIKETNVERYGVDYYAKTEECKEKIKNTSFERYGVKHYAQTEECKEKKKETNLKKYGVENYTQTGECKEKTRGTNLKKYGVPYASQNPIIKRKILSHKGKTKPEIEFEEFLKENNYSYQYEVDFNYKNFDFVIYKDEKVDIVVEIDGEYVHGLQCDYDFKYVRGDKDYLRFSKVPSNVKFIVCDSERVKEIENIFPEIYNQTYEEWLETLKSQIPSNFPYYNFSEKRLHLDYKHLCEYKTCKLTAQIGTSSILYFCKSLFSISKDNLPSMIEAWRNKELINRLIDERYLYYSEFSSHSILDGFKDCPYVYRKEIISPSLIRYIIKKYVGDDSIFDPNSSPSILLATSSLGKNYTSICKNSTLKNELEKMVKFHNIKTVNFVDSPNEVSALMTEIEDEKEIDFVVSSYNAKKYLFLINKESNQAIEIFSTDLEDKNKFLSIIIIDGRS